MSTAECEIYEEKFQFQLCFRLDIFLCSKFEIWNSKFEFWNSRFQIPIDFDSFFFFLSLLIFHGLLNIIKDILNSREYFTNHLTISLVNLISWFFTFWAFLNKVVKKKRELFPIYLPILSSLFMLPYYYYYLNPLIFLFFITIYSV